MTTEFNIFKWIWNQFEKHEEKKIQSQKEEIERKENRIKELKEEEKKQEEKIREEKQLSNIEQQTEFNKILALTGIILAMKALFDFFNLNITTIFNHGNFKSFSGVVALISGLVISILLMLALAYLVKILTQLILSNKNKEKDKK